MDNKEYYKKLLDRALSQIKETACMISGPIGVGIDSFDKNIEKLKNNIDLISQKEIVFNQIPYLDIYLEDSPKDYSTKFEIFYKGLIQSGKISKLYISKGSQNSKGVISEIEYAKEKDILIVYL